MPTISAALAIAIEHHQGGRLPAAEQIYRQILQADPNQADALHLLGVIAHQVGRNEVAVEYIERSIALKGSAPGPYNNLAQAYQALQKIPEAIASCRRALELHPTFPGAHNNLGNALMVDGKLDEAIACFQRAVELQPDLAQAHSNLGNALKDQGKLEEAIVCYRRALEWHPEYAEGWSNLGNSLKDQEKLEEAVACLRRALELKPDLAEAHLNLGLALKDQGKLDEALVCFRRALALKPVFPEAHNDLGILLLLLGHYEEGWQEFESRLECNKVKRRFSKPRWNGERAVGQTILIHVEQGFGDALQFIRYVPLVRARSGAARVIMETLPGVVRLLTQNGGWDAEIVSGLNSDESGLPPYDLQVPLMSVPRALGLIEPLSAGSPYLHADPALRRDWRERLGSGSATRVGLVWAGNPEHKADHLRSMPADRFLPLLRIPGFEFYTLQIGSQHHASTLTEAGLIDHTAHLEDFADTAAFVAELDLIISVDTAVAHLGAAMGRPVWLLLPYQSEWRWGLKGETTPWYPTMRLFRQPVPGDWAAVVQRLAAELGKLVNDK
jgi:tetratricopeptide (TPR) repeat protein